MRHFSTEWIIFVFLTQVPVASSFHVVIGQSERVSSWNEIKRMSTGWMLIYLSTLIGFTACAGDGCRIQLVEIGFRNENKISPSVAFWLATHSSRWEYSRNGRLVLLTYTWKSIVLLIFQLTNDSFDKITSLPMKSASRIELGRNRRLFPSTRQLRRWYFSRYMKWRSRSIQKPIGGKICTLLESYRDRLRKKDDRF